MAATPITLFEVPPEADEAFLATRGASGATLYRALRPDVEFRYAELSTAVTESPYPAHPGVYDVVREHGRPDTSGGVVLINPFEVPEGDDERFLAGWDAARAALASRRGYIGTRLHRSVGPADFRFVNVARWSSPLMFARALAEPEFQAAAQGMPFPSHPALYLVVG